MDIWQPNFFASSFMFNPLGDIAKNFQDYASWPNHQEFNQHLDKTICSANGTAIQTIAQQPKHVPFDEQYEPRIYLKGELQTRLQNWHDFFNYAVWRTFPKTKAHLNALQYKHLCQQREQGSKQRTVQENFLTMFDECGIIVCSTDPGLLQLIRDFRWHELFWQRRDEVKKHIQFILFGHAMYEKALAPYIGLTAKAVLLETATTEKLDEQLKQHLDDNFISNTKHLSPLPILGVPGWCGENEQELFYYDERYFRKGRK